jgi:hypothetical protein
MEIRNFKPVNHQSIKASFNVYIPQYDLYLNKMVLVSTSKGKFVSAPSEKYEKDGETKYFPYWSFGKDSNKKFQEAIMILLKPLMEKLEQPQKVPQEVPQENTYEDDLPF